MVQRQAGRQRPTLVDVGRLAARGRGPGMSDADDAAWSSQFPIAEGGLLAGSAQFNGPAEQVRQQLIAQGMAPGLAEILCGPIAASGLLRAFGLEDDPGVVGRSAWDAGQFTYDGMAGAGSMQALMGSFGLETEILPGEDGFWKAAEQLQATGKPFVADFPLHYMLVQDLRQRTDGEWEFFVGTSGSNALGGGADWMTLGEMNRNPGNKGAIQNALVPTRDVNPAEQAGTAAAVEGANAVRSTGQPVAEMNDTQRRALERWKQDVAKWDAGDRRVQHAEDVEWKRTQIAEIEARAATPATTGTPEPWGDPARNGQAASSATPAEPTDPLKARAYEMAREYGVDPLILDALVTQESGWDTNALGDNGNSHGLLQANQAGGRGAGHSTADLRDPEYNLRIGLEELAPIYKRLYAEGWRGAALAQELGRLGQRPQAGLESEYAERYNEIVSGGGSVTPTGVPRRPQGAVGPGGQPVGSSTGYSPRPVPDQEARRGQQIGAVAAGSSSDRLTHDDRTADLVTPASGGTPLRGPNGEVLAAATRGPMGNAYDRPDQRVQERAGVGVETGASPLAEANAAVVDWLNQGYEDVVKPTASLALERQQQGEDLAAALPFPTSPHFKKAVGGLFVLGVPSEAIQAALTSKNEFGGDYQAALQAADGYYRRFKREGMSDTAAAIAGFATLAALDPLNFVPLKMPGARAAVQEATEGMARAGVRYGQRVAQSTGTSVARYGERLVDTLDTGVPRAVSQGRRASEGEIDDAARAFPLTDDSIPNPDSFGRMMLEQLPSGSPGLQVKQGDGATRLVYYGPDKRPVGYATIVDGPNQSAPGVSEMALDRTRGLLSGRAASAIGDEIARRGALRPSGSVSTDAQELIASYAARNPASALAGDVRAAAPVSAGRVAPRSAASATDPAPGAVSGALPEPRVAPQSAIPTDTFPESSPTSALDAAASVAQPASRRMFHGTPDPFEQVDPSRFREGTLGPEYHLTDDAEVASGYATKRASGESAAYQASKAEHESAVFDQTFLRQNGVADDAPEMAAAVRREQAAAEHVRATPKTEGGPNVRAVDLPSDMRLLDLGNDADRTLYRSLAVRHGDDLNAINRELAKRGYDGIRRGAGDSIPLSRGEIPPYHAETAIFQESIGKVRNALSGQPEAVIQAAKTVEAVNGAQAAKQVERAADGRITRLMDAAGRWWKRMYHGTGDAYTSPSPAKFDNKALAGPAHYLSAEPRVVDSYSRVAGEGIVERMEEDELRYVMTELDRQFPELGGYANTRLARNLGQSTEREQQFQQLVDQMVRDGVPRDRAAKAVEYLIPTESGVGAQVRIIDVPEDLRLFDFDAPADFAAVERTLKKLPPAERARLEEVLGVQWTQRDRVGELASRRLRNDDLYDALVAFHDGNKAKVNKMMAANGIDGIRYKGGQRMPLKDDAGQAVEHEAYAIFEQALPKIKNSLSGKQGGSVDVAFALHALPAAGGALGGNYLADQQNADPLTRAEYILGGLLAGAIVGNPRTAARLGGAALKGAGTVYQSGLVSAPITPTRNVAGMIPILLTKPLVKAASAAWDVPVSIAQHRPREHFFREIPIELKAQAGALGDAWHSSLETLRRGVDPENPFVNPDLRQLIGGGKNPFNYPFRAATAGDVFFSTLLQAGEMRSLAYRHGRQSGLRGAALDAYVQANGTIPDLPRLAAAIQEAKAQNLVGQQFAEFVESAGGIGDYRLIEKSVKGAKYATFNQEMDAVGRVLTTIQQKPGGKFFVPFVAIPYNIAKWELAHSPVGGVYAVGQAVFQGGHGAAVSERLGRATVGSVAAGIAYLLYKDDKLTGRNPFAEGTQEQRDLWLQDHQEYSIWSPLEGKWRSYALIPGFALNAALIVGADQGITKYYTKVADKQAKQEASGLPIDPAAFGLGALAAANGMAKAFKERSFIDNFADTLDVMTGGKQIEEIGPTFERMIASAIPNVVARIAQGMDPTVREPQGIDERLRARSPFHSQTVPARQDSEGQPLVREQNWQDVPSILAQQFNPAQSKTPRNDPTTAELVARGEAYPRPPEEIGGRPLTRAEQREYQRILGQAEKFAMDAIIATPEYQAADPATRKKMLATEQAATAREVKEHQTGTLGIDTSPDVRALEDGTVEPAKYLRATMPKAISEKYPDDVKLRQAIEAAREKRGKSVAWHRTKAAERVGPEPPLTDEEKTLSNKRSDGSYWIKTDNRWTAWSKKYSRENGLEADAQDVRVERAVEQVPATP